MTPGATETTPIVHDGVLFIYELRRQDPGAQRGDRRPDLGVQARPAGEADRRGRNQLAKRNMAIYGDKLIIATSDAHIVALDAKTGKVVWDHADRRLEQGLALHRRPVRRQRHDGPGHDRLRQRRAGRLLHHRPRRQDRRGAVARQHHRASATTPNCDTWNGLPLESRFGASAWISGSYDPEQNLVFYGIGQPYPWIAEMRGTLPREARPQEQRALHRTRRSRSIPTTGKLKWYHQYLAERHAGTSTTSMSACWSTCRSTARRARWW